MGRYRNVSILAAAVFIQLIGLAVQIKVQSKTQAENESTRLIRVWTVTAITPLEKALVRVQNGASSLWHNYVYLRGVRQENRELQNQIQQLQLEQVRLNQDAEQARRLQAILRFKEEYIAKTTAAQVIGSSGSEQSRTIYLDKGAEEGIARDMPVISAEGIVGKVVKVFPHTSLVLLINDQNSGVGTSVERSRLQAVLQGKPGGRLALANIMTDEDVKAGDRILTSGGDQIFPKGLPVGTVGSVVSGHEFLQVNVRPAAALNHLEEVLVITQKLERTPEPLDSGSARAAEILARRLPSVPDKPPAASIPTTQVKPNSAVNVQPGASTGISARPAVPKPQTAGQPMAGAPANLEAARSKPAQSNGLGTAVNHQAGAVAPQAAKPAVVPASKPAHPNSTPAAEQSDSGDTPR